MDKPNEGVYDIHSGSYGQWPEWVDVRDKKFAVSFQYPHPSIGYSGRELALLEQVYMAPISKLMSNLYKGGNKDVLENGIRKVINLYNAGKIDLPGYEDANYEGFVAALEVLKEIHISRGEDVDLSLKLVKKQPVMA